MSSQLSWGACHKGGKALQREKLLPPGCVIAKQECLHGQALYAAPAVDLWLQVGMAPQLS